jgi:hypothetical protein
MLWAYFAYSQWIIIWSGNLPEEISWYLHRNRGGWQWIITALVVFHFIVPFLLLLSRKVKRPAAALCAVAASIVVMRLVDIFWYTAPAFNPGHFTIHWMDIAAPIGLGGIWLAAFSGICAAALFCRCDPSGPGYLIMLEHAAHGPTPPRGTSKAASIPAVGLRFGADYRRYRSSCWWLFNFSAAKLAPATVRSAYGNRIAAGANLGVAAQHLEERAPSKRSSTATAGSTKTRDRQNPIARHGAGRQARLAGAKK